MVYYFQSVGKFVSKWSVLSDNIDEALIGFTNELRDAYYTDGYRVKKTRRILKGMSGEDVVVLKII